MRISLKIGVLALLAATLCACETMPGGPSVAVMPAQGKPFDLFQQEDGQCRRFAAQSLGPHARYAGNQAVVGSAVVGTALGAAVGGLAGGSRGASSGAAIGLAGGTMVGASQAEYAGYGLQRRYDIAYQQCMYTKGNQLPQVRRYRTYYNTGDDYGPRYYYEPPHYYRIYR